MPLARDDNQQLSAFVGIDGKAGQATLGEQSQVETGVALTRFFSTTPYLTGNTAAWTPAAGKRFRLKRFMIMAPGVATTATALTTIDLRDGNASIGVAIQVSLPSTAGATPGFAFITPWIDLGDGYLSSAPGNVLNVNLSQTITGAGSLQVIVAGVEE